MHTYKVWRVVCCLHVVITHKGYDSMQNANIIATNKAEIVTVQEYETAILPCSNDIKGDNKVIWIGPDFKLLAIEDKLTQNATRISVNRQSPSSWDLRINEVVHDDQGIYECRINSQPAVVKPVILVVQIRPMIQPQYSRNITVYEGTDVELQCLSTGIPPPTVTWYRVLNDDQQKREKLETDGEASYTISNMTMSKAGTYECHASNGVGKGAREIFYIKCNILTTFIVPDVENVTVQEGETAILPCVVQNLGDFKVSWSNDYARISSGRKLSYLHYFGFKRPLSPEDWSLQIDSASEMLSGKYACQLEQDLLPIRKKIVNFIVKM